MATVTLYKCDGCERIIQKPEDGLVVHGNIYVADPNHRGGLIGNNFPEVKPKRSDNVFTESAVKETVFCIPCFMQAIDHRLPPKTRSGITA